MQLPECQNKFLMEADTSINCQEVNLVKEQK